MVFPKARLVVSAGLFVAWLGFLFYLVVRTREPVVLSRPQLAVSALVVIADVGEKEGRPLANVTVKKVAWARPGVDCKLAGTQVTVDGLADCGRAQGWAGAGTYILPLTRREGDANYEVTPLPLSPGYPGYPGGSIPPYVTTKDVATGRVRHNVPREEAEDMRKTAKASILFIEGESRIYRATDDALAQLEELKKE